MLILASSHRCQLTESEIICMCAKIGSDVEESPKVQDASPTNPEQLYQIVSY